MFSEIDFCLKLTDKTQDDIQTIIRSIQVNFLVILSDLPTLQPILVEQLYKKCNSETVRHYNLTPQIIETLSESIPIQFSKVIDYLGNEMHETISRKGREKLGMINIRKEVDEILGTTNLTRKQLLCPAKRRISKCFGKKTQIS